MNWRAKLAAVLTATGLALLSVPHAATAATADTAPQVTEITLTSGGERRWARVSVPQRFAERRAMVLALHGGGGNPEEFARTNGFEAMGARDGVLIVHPAGTGRLSRKLLTWNAGACCGTAQKAGKDDVGFLVALIRKLVADHHIDPALVFMTGHSNGSQMTYRLACEHPELLGAAAPVGAGSVSTDSCMPRSGKAVPILHIHGREDPCARFDGGDCGGCWKTALGDLGLGRAGAGDTGWACAPIPTHMQNWATALGCGKPTTGAGGRDTLWQGCRNGATVQLTAVPGGHPWPGSGRTAACAGADGGRREKLCAAMSKATGPAPDYPASDAIFAFFKARM